MYKKTEGREKQQQQDMFNGLIETFKSQMKCLYWCMCQMGTITADAYVQWVQ